MYRVDQRAGMHTNEKLHVKLITDYHLSPTITQDFFNSHWLAVSACRLLLQGVIAVIHGWLFVHWATLWAKGSGIEELLLMEE